MTDSKITHQEQLKPQLFSNDVEVDGHMFICHSLKAMEDANIFMPELGATEAQTIMIENINSESPVSGFLITTRPFGGRIDVKFDILFANNDIAKETHKNASETAETLMFPSSAIYDCAENLLKATGNNDYSLTHEASRVSLVTDGMSRRNRGKGISLILHPTYNFPADPKVMGVIFDEELSPELPAMRKMFDTAWERFQSPENLSVETSQRHLG